MSVLPSVIITKVSGKAELKCRRQGVCSVSIQAEKRGDNSGTRKFTLLSNRKLFIDCYNFVVKF